MEPNYKQIAELFQVPKVEIPAEGESAELPKEGQTAAESAELGRLHLGNGDYQEAIKHFRRAMEQRGESIESDLTDLGAAYEYANLAPQAFRQYRLALRVSENATDARIGLADLYLRTGHTEKSVSELITLVEAEPGNPYLHSKLALVLRDKGDLAGAYREGQAAVAAKPDDPFYHTWLGDLQLQMGLYQEALDSFRAAIELSPGDDYLYIRAAVGLWRVGRQAEALKSIRLASELDPSKDLYHGLLEELLTEMGQDEEAALEQDRSEQMDSFDHSTLSKIITEMGIEA